MLRYALHFVSFTGATKNNNKQAHLPIIINDLTVGVIVLLVQVKPIVLFLTPRFSVMITAALFSGGSKYILKEASQSNNVLRRRRRNSGFANCVCSERRFKNVK